MSRVAVVIVMWNSRRFLKNLLFSLHEMELPEGGVSFIFVDNASTDDSAAYVRERFQGAIILQNTHNLGFAGGNNAGLHHPLARGAEYVALLNHDTIVEKDWLVELVKAMKSNAAIASAQSLLLYDQDRLKINSAGNEIHFLGFGFSRENGQKFEIRNSKFEIRTIAYASGAAVLYRRNLLEEIGLFDEDLFMYHEDLDAGWKFLLKGYQNILVPSSIVYHHYEFTRSIRKYYWQERNRLLLLLTHYKTGTMVLLLPALLALEIGLMFFSLIRGFFKSRMQAYRWIFTHIPTIFRKRKFVQQLRTQSDSEVLKYFTGVITDQEVANPVVTYLMNPIFSVYLTYIRKIVRW